MSDDFKSREAEVDYLLHIEFPLSNAPPPMGAGQSSHLDHLRRQSERADRRTELLALPLAALREKAIEARARERAADEERRERATPPLIEANARYWMQREEWSLYEGVLLLIDIEPRSPRGLRLRANLEGKWMRFPGISEVEALALLSSGTLRDDMAIAWQEEWNKLSDSARQAFLVANDILTNARSAIRRKNLVVDNDELLIPRDFIRWAKNRCYSGCAPYAELIQDEPTVEGLQARINELEVDLARTSIDESTIDAAADNRLETDEASSAADNERRDSDGSRREDDPEPRYDHWSKLERWTLQQGTCLLLHVEPTSRLGRFIADNWEKSYFRRESDFTWSPPWAIGMLPEAWCIRDYASASREAGTLRLYGDGDLKVEPRSWLCWADDKGLIPPPQMRQLISDRPSREQLEQQIAQLRAEKESLPTARPTQEEDEAAGKVLMAWAYLARKYNHNPGATKNNSTSRVIREFELNKLKITDKPVTKWLDKASEKYPPQD